MFYLFKKWRFIGSASEVMFSKLMYVEAIRNDLLEMKRGVKTSLRLRRKLILQYQ